MILAILNIGPIEILIVVGAAVLLFGGDLPQVARKAARVLGRLRALSSELAREFQEEVPPELKRPPRLDLPKLGLDEDLRQAARLDDPVTGEEARPHLPGDPFAPPDVDPVSDEDENDPHDKPHPTSS